MTAVRQTSIDAYVDTGYERSLQQQQVLGALGKDINTRRELAKKLGMEASTLSGRVNELIKAGKVEVVESKITCSVTGRRVEGVRRVTLAGRW